MSDPLSAVIDSSVVLNLLGSSRPKMILESLPYSILVPSQVLTEIQTEPVVPNRDADLHSLLASGLLSVAQSSPEIEDLAIQLAGAQSPDDLDDGEAYAIAHAVALNGLLGIDERKGRRIVSARWPHLRCIYSLELLEAAFASANIQDREKVSILYAALTNARMRVPASRKREIAEFLGEELASLCPSLGIDRLK